MVVLTADYGQLPGRLDERPPFRPGRLLASWLVSATAILVVAAILPGLRVAGWRGALLAALLLATINAALPPLLAAIALPLTVATSFVLVLAADAGALLLVDAVTRTAVEVDGFWWALLAALLAAAVAMVVEAVVGTNDDEIASLRVVHRVARKAPGRVESASPGIVFLELDGLPYSVLRRALRDGNAPNLARWLQAGTHRLVAWETDLSAQTGAMQAGILLGANDDIPAFRWVDKATGRVVSCSSPRDCAAIERRLAGRGLLRDGGASRGNLLAGEADHVILTASRVTAERRANPGYRAFFATGTAAVRTVVLVAWEVVLELVAAARQRRRDIRPRGSRGGAYPLVRAGLCVGVRDLVAYAVLSDMFAGRPVVFATLASYDKVAHHSGLERADTLEALRKLDVRLGQLDRARRYAPRPYHLVVLSDHGQTQGATFLQRNGYGLADLVERSLEAGQVEAIAGGDEEDAALEIAFDEATGRGERSDERRSRKLEDRARGDAVVLGSGNLGLVYLLEEPRRLTLEEIQARHPRLVPALVSHPHVGFVLARSAEHGPLVLGAGGTRRLADDVVDGDDPLAPFSSHAATHLRRSDGFANAPDLWVNSFYDPELDDACAFEELISFHGGLGGPQTEPFLLAPVELPLPDEPLVGAAAVHELFSGWRSSLQGRR